MEYSYLNLNKVQLSIKKHNQKIETNKQHIYLNPKKQTLINFKVDFEFAIAIINSFGTIYTDILL